MTRRVLLITVGETPQVVTETVYGLIAEWRWVPHEIVLATTSTGEERFTQGGRGLPPLVGPEGRLAAMYRQLRLPPVEPRVIVARTREGARLADVRSDAEVTAFADRLVEVVREITAQPDSELHLSLAGGRKTMSYLAGAVLSIYGRPRDVLSHVLVEPAPLEGPQSGFWWPGQPEPIAIDLKGETPKILLHSVGFVRLRAHLPNDELFHGGLSFAEAVGKANEALAADRLIIDLLHREVRVGRERVEFTHTHPLAMMAMFALAAKRGTRISEGANGPRLADRTSYVEAWTHMLGALQALPQLARGTGDFQDAAAEHAAEAAKHQPASMLRTPRSQLRACLRRKLPRHLAERVLAPGRMPATGFAAEAIEIRAPEPMIDWLAQQTGETWAPFLSPSDASSGQP